VRKDTTPWVFFKSKSIEIFDFDEIELSILDTRIQYNNIKNITEFFSEKVLITQLRNIFYTNEE
jgi:hypothetical protein